MTPYIQQQLKKLCDNPNWYDDMLISWDKNPRNQREAIYNYLSHVQLNGLLENTQIVFTFIDDVNQVYAPGVKFETIEQIQEYFDYVHLESQEIKLISTTTAIKQI